MTHEGVLKGVIDFWKKDPDPSLLNNTNAWILWIKRYTYQNKMSDNPNFKNIKLLVEFIDGVNENIRQQILAVKDAHENDENVQLLEELRQEYDNVEEEADPIYNLYANANTVTSPKVLKAGKPLPYHISKSFYSPCEISGRIMDIQKAMPSVEDPNKFADGEKFNSTKKITIRRNVEEAYDSNIVCPGSLFELKPNPSNDSSLDVSTRMLKVDRLYLPKINNLSSVAKSLVNTPKPNLMGLERPIDAPELTKDIINDLRRLRMRSPDDIIVSGFSMQMLQKDLMLFYAEDELLIDKNAKKIHDTLRRTQWSCVWLQPCSLLRKGFGVLLNGETWSNYDTNILVLLTCIIGVIQNIDFYLEIIRERSKTKGFPTVFVYRSVFYPILNVSDGNYDDVKNATENEDIFCYDMVFFPVIYGQHWRLVVLCPQMQSLTCFDSVEHNNTKILRDIANYLQYVHGSKISKKAISEIRPGDVNIDVPVETKKLTVHINPCNEVPLQTNSTDCGVFLLVYAEYLSRRQPFNFTQSHVPYFRKRITYEVMQKSILLSNVP